MKLNYYSCLTATTASQQIELDQFLNWLKYPSSNPAYQQIIRVREAQSQQDKDLYKEQLPCILFAYTTTDNKKTLSSITGTTGLVFLDIDNPDFTPDIITNTNYIIACYKSSSNNGYHILLSVKGLSLNKDEFENQVYELAEVIGVKSYIDKRAIKRTQVAYLTFDDNAIVNDNYSTYKFESTVPISKITKDKPVYMNEVGTRKPIRFDDTDTIPFDEDEAYKVDFSEGFEVIKAFLIPYKLTDNRYNTLLAYCTNLVYLNPQLSKEKVLDMITNTSMILTTDGYSKNKIQKIVDTVFRYKIEGKLEAIKFNKRRKIIFSPMMKAKLTKEEKQTIVLDEIARNKTNQSKQRINNIIQNWDSINGRITVRNIASNFEINKKTVSKYYNQFNNKITLINSFVPTSKITKKPLVYMTEMGTDGWKRLKLDGYVYLSQNQLKPVRVRFMDAARFRTLGMLQL